MEQRKKCVWKANDYSKYCSSQYKWANELIPKLELSGKEALLDIVYGDSKITEILAKS